MDAHHYLLLIFCCASQIDFSLAKEDDLSKSHFSRIFNIIFAHIFQMKTQDSWTYIFNYQNMNYGSGGCSMIDHISPQWMKYYVSTRLKFYSSLLPYLVSDRLPNYKQTIQNLYEAMHVEYLVDNSIILCSPYSFSIYNRVEETGEMYYGKPTSSFIDAIKDIVFEAKIL